MNTNRNVTLFSLIAAFGGFVFGLDAANLSGAVRFISSYFELTNEQTGLLGSVTLLGVIFALLFTGTLCERFGRKRILISIALIYSLSSIISAAALTYEMLVFGRFIGGVAFASITVSAMYIGEIAPADKRGKFVAVNQLMIAIGLLLAFIINYFLVKGLSEITWLHNDNVWRYMLGAELIANIIWASLLLMVPESPRWLVKKSRYAEAEIVFEKIQEKSEIPTVIEQIKNSLNNELKSDTLTQLKTLFSKKMNLVVWIAVVYAIVQGATGMNAVLFFAPMVFEQVGMSVEDTFMQTIIMGFVGLVSTVIAIVTVEKLGRRFLTLAGLALVVVAHASTWYGFNDATYVIDQKAKTNIIEQLENQPIDINKLVNLADKTYTSDVELKRALAQVFDKKELPLVSGAVINSTIQNVKPGLVLFGIFAFLAAFNLSIGPIMWVIFSEVFPNQVRSVALPFAAMVQTISSFSITQILPWQLDNQGVSTIFLIYGLLAVFGLVVMSFILPETKGKSIEQIEKDLVRN